MLINSFTASGMHYLHVKQIVHRDLKSANILVCDDNQLKICDFGTSKKCDGQQKDNVTFVGTCAWIAPEIIKNEKSTEKVDVSDRVEREKTLSLHGFRSIS